MLIGGELVDGAGTSVEIVNPATEDSLTEVASATREQVDAAVSAARGAFRDWKRTPAPERAEMLHALSTWITEHTDSLATTLTREGGKPLVENRDEMGWSASCFDFYAEGGRLERGRERYTIYCAVARSSGAARRTPTSSGGEDRMKRVQASQRAAREREILAPLAEVGLTKAEVRELSAAMGLPTADKPASPCLASRFAYGVRVTHEGLRRIEQAEDIVRALGFEVFRVRDHGDLARIELPEGDIERGAALKHELATELAALGFRYVTLDLTGFRSGSMNEVLPPSIRH
jgi:hypothetical protein